MVIALMLVFSKPSTAQKVLLDEGIRAGELQFFPVLGAENNYYYLLDKVRIARKNGQPQFSFVKYTKVDRDNSDSKEQAEVGGFLHALVEFHIPEEMKKEAERALRRVNPRAKILGPAMYESGKVAVISAMLDEKEGKYIKKVVGVGNAPILEGQKMAIGMELTRDGAELLWSTMDMPASQISLAFDMSLQGYRSPKKVKIQANFSKIYQHKTFEAAAVTPVFAGEINKAYEELRKEEAIKVTFQGEDEDLEKAFEVAYGKLTKMLLDPVSGTGTPDLKQLTQQGKGQQSMLDRMTGMLKDARKEAREIRKETIQFIKPDPSRKDVETEALNYHLSKIYQEYLSKIAKAEQTSNGKGGTSDIPNLAFGASYRLKKNRQKLDYNIDLEKYGTGSISIPFSENLSIGPKDCPECFAIINLDKLFGKQREITVQLDGATANDFKNYINFVNVKLRKKHETGDVTFDEVKIDRQKFNQTANNYKLVYGTGSGDEDVDLWEQYDYQITWNFFGGTTVGSDWIKGDQGLLSLDPPLLRKTISFETDKEVMTDIGVRSIIIRTFYQGQPYAEQRINTAKEIFEESIDAIVSSKTDEGFKYEVSWFFKDSDKNFTSPQKAGKMELVFLDSPLED